MNSEIEKYNTSLSANDQKRCSRTTQIGSLI